MSNKKQKGFIPLVFLIAILIVVAGGGMYYYYAKKVSTQKPPNLDYIAPQKTQSSVPSDWKTYRNEEYGFEFKYPPDLFLSKEQFLITESVAFADIPERDLAQKVFSLQILKEYNKEHVPLLKLVSKNIPENMRQYVQLETHFINGAEVVFIISNYPQKSSGFAVDFVRGGDVFEFWPSAPPESLSKGEIDRTTLESIVKTFKFTK